MITYLIFGVSRDKFCALLTVKILRFYKIVLARIAMIEFNLFLECCSMGVELSIELQYLIYYT